MARANAIASSRFARVERAQPLLNFPFAHGLSLNGSKFRADFADPALKRSDAVLEVGQAVHAHTVAGGRGDFRQISIQPAQFPLSGLKLGTRVLDLLGWKRLVWAGIPTAAAEQSRKT